MFILDINATTVGSRNITSKKNTHNELEISVESTWEVNLPAFCSLQAYRVYGGFASYVWVARNETKINENEEMYLSFYFELS